MHRKKSFLNLTVKKFVKQIHTKFSPVKIILFGSRAKGDALEYSDYDFIIVSDKFKDVHWLNRISEIVAYWDYDRSIDVLPYTQSEFEQKQKLSSVVQEAVKHGINV